MIKDFINHLFTSFCSIATLMVLVVLFGGIEPFGLMMVAAIVIGCLIGMGIVAVLDWMEAKIQGAINR